MDIFIIFYSDFIRGQQGTLYHWHSRLLVQDWYKTDQTRRIVRSAVAEVLDRELPQESYDRALF